MPTMFEKKEDKPVEPSQIKKTGAPLKMSATFEKKEEKPKENKFQKNPIASRFGERKDFLNRMMSGGMGIMGQRPPTSSSIPSSFPNTTSSSPSEISYGETFSSSVKPPSFATSTPSTGSMEKGSNSITPSHVEPAPSILGEIKQPIIEGNAEAVLNQVVVVKKTKKKPRKKAFGGD